MGDYLKCCDLPTQPGLFAWYVVLSHCNSITHVIFERGFFDFLGPFVYRGPTHVVILKAMVILVYESSSPS